MRTLRWLGLVAVVLTAVAGCGGSRERNKNQDEGRPKATAAR